MNWGDTKLVLTSELDGYTVSSIGREAFKNASGITDIHIPESIVNIEGNPFSSLMQLQRIEIPPEQPAYAVIDGVLFRKADKMLVSYPSGITQV